METTNLQQELEKIMTCNANSVKKYIDSTISSLEGLSRDDLMKLSNDISTIKSILEKDENDDIDFVTKTRDSIANLQSTIDNLLLSNAELKDSLREAEVNITIDSNKLCSIFNDTLNSVVSCNIIAEGL